MSWTTSAPPPSDARVRVDPLAAGEPFAAAVARLDQAHDLAVLLSAVPLADGGGDLTATDQMAPQAAGDGDRAWRDRQMPAAPPGR